MGGFLKSVAPIGLSLLAPGLGTALGAGLGFTGIGAGIAGNALIGGGLGALGGGGLKGAALGAATGGLAGGGGSALGRAAGLTGTGANTFGGALAGAVGGAGSGEGLKGAALGAALGGAGGYLSSGGSVPGLGSVSRTGPGGMGPPTQGTGLLGNLTKSSPIGGGISSLTGGNTSMLGNALKIGGGIFEDMSTRENNEEIAKQLQMAQGNAQSRLNPYTQTGTAATGQLSDSLSAGFQPGDLTQDPGYQFRLQQGEEALARRMAASGMGQSGAALKAAQEYGQGLADQTYNDAYSRWLSGNQQLQGAANMGMGAASGSAGLDMYGGQTMAELMAANQESKNKRLSSILSGVGAFL